MPEQMVMDETIENLLRAFRKKLTPNAVRRLREVGVDVEQKLKPMYPRTVHDEVLRLLAEELYPGLPMDVASFKIGEESIRVIEDWLIGRTMMAVLRLLPYRAALKRVPSMLRTGNNYMDAKVTDLGGKRYTIEFNEIGAWPHYWLGLMGTANKMLLGYKRSTITLKSYDGHYGLVEVDLEPATGP